MAIINKTPHAINLPGGITIPPSGDAVRVSVQLAEAGERLGSGDREDKTMKTQTANSERLPASASSARWARTIIKLEKFGRKYVTISCFGWSSERTAKIGIHELPRTIRPLAGSYVIAMATIEAKHLQVSNIEPDSQKTSEDIEADWKAITQNGQEQARRAKD